MSKSSQITALFAFLAFLGIFIPEIIFYSQIKIQTHPLYVLVSLVPFPFFLGVIINQVPKNINEKLKYLNGKYFSPLLEFLYRVHPEYFINIDDIQKLYDEIIKYGKYHFIPCYPYFLMKNIENYIKNSNKHNKLLTELQSESREIIGKDNLSLLNRVLKLLPDDDIQRYDSNTINRYRKVADHITKNKPKLLENIKLYNNETRKIIKIIEDFKHFLKENSLENLNLHQK